MFREAPQPAPKSPITATTRSLLWTVIAFNAMTVVWMSVGDWGSTSLLTSVITLGGHRWLVLSLAVIGFVLLAGLAPSTHGFVEANRLQQSLIPVAGVVSLVAMAGLLSVAALGAAGLLVVWLLFGGRPPQRINVTHRRR